MIVVPAIDVRRGRVVRLRQGRVQDETVYGQDPAEVARRWESEGARRIHLVDLDAAIDGLSQAEAVGAVVRAVRVPVEVGGGLRSLEEALLDFAGSALIISHDRWFLDRVATHIHAFEGQSQVFFFEGKV